MDHGAYTVVGMLAFVAFAVVLVSIETRSELPVDIAALLAGVLGAISGVHAWLRRPR